jgi:hypothetical protein
MPRHHSERLPSGARLAIGLGALAGALAAVPASGQSAGAGNGFLLGKPVGSLSIRAGYDHALAGSDIFTDPATIGQLTIGKNDFSGASGAVDVGIRMSDRFDFVLGSAYAGTNKRSHYRDFTEGDDNREIEQTTAFQRVPISGSVRMYLAPRGRSVGKFAWIPNKVAPYIGGGGGLMWYRFRQSGDFLDFASSKTNPRIYTATTETSGWTAEGHAFAGLDYPLNPRLALTGESRYTFGRGPISSDYVGFQRIDLSGVAFTAGVAVRF